MANVVIFGITGDLSRRRLIPALAKLWDEGKLKKGDSFVGFGRKNFLDEEFRSFIKECSPASKSGRVSGRGSFLDAWRYVNSEIDDMNGYAKLRDLVGLQAGKKTGGAKVKESRSSSPRSFFYISLPPKYQPEVLRNIFAAGVMKRNDGGILAIEKPFGTDSSSAKKLNNLLLSKLNDNQICRVDHYAGKEEMIYIEEMGKKGKLSSMSSASIKRMEINFLEQAAAAGRGAFYDQVGALNDVCQNHVIHMMSTILAAPYAKMKKYPDIRAFAASSLQLAGKPILGQYSSFIKESGVSAASKTETFFKTENILRFPKGKAFAKLNAVEKNLAKRWRGLKVSLCGGKALSDDLVNICFHRNGGEALKDSSICIVTSRHGAKDAYQTIFESVLSGKMNLSVSIKQVIAGWKYVERVKKQDVKVEIYKDGSGPLAI